MKGEPKLVRKSKNARHWHKKRAKLYWDAEVSKGTEQAFFFLLPLPLFFHGWVSPGTSRMPYRM
ncbi:hypothetical protein DT065_06245 [Salicibibacter kimchii]|uniref:Uncharacterized protein n=1 Tax=Salicibibacter kimchii TaxID=2099786 RepID=A0A345BXH9_9BACI|nr:hypothetical protein DT065_06245 [Salicibibacter kimchii]